MRVVRRTATGGALKQEILSSSVSKSSRQNAPHVRVTGTPLIKDWGVRANTVTQPRPLHAWSRRRVAAIREHDGDTSFPKGHCTLPTPCPPKRAMHRSAMRSGDMGLIRRRAVRAIVRSPDEVDNAPLTMTPGCFSGRLHMMSIPSVRAKIAF